ncbi:HTTM domain-containing protein [Salinimicrobium sediminilitoris]|uniref:HTTM domain-containing protein n=1 Tax=Salinimicrobium sediminilitoris TaxID=2876715 RepID=UPI001E4C5D4D|nr:HTTM domain-containing protein [Salinimicrobium sediminilitoris]MCC8358583.1 HTTM domain-containing protein [Salinimicrobium sediminilitoris]
MNNLISNYLRKDSEAAPLAVFRIFFGIMMFGSILRFWLNGWIEKLYIAPDFFFSYYGFEWVKPLGYFTYLLFLLCAISALMIAFGYKYRLAAITFFLSFTYIELMDKTTYLNHYYFISILGFLLIFLPAASYFSVDAYRDPKKAFQRVPSWCIDSIKLLLAMVYFYAGLAKINSDWLFRAMPLKIWLPSNYDLPLLGDLLQQEWVHYFFSWTGMIYDLAIPFLLFFRKTRRLAFVLVVIFHVLTRILFPIGMFPYIMIVSALIFFDAGLHHKILQKISGLIKISKARFDNAKSLQYLPKKRKILLSFLSLFFLIQFLFPWRYLLYPGELFWTEEGFRFSWRVMLMEKAGYAQFRIIDRENGKSFYVNNGNFLTPFQEKQMSFQPDFILQYAHFLGDHYRKKGIEQVEVYVDSHVALNGRKSTPFINPRVNLLEHQDTFRQKTFILPFNDTIKGL